MKEKILVNDIINVVEGSLLTDNSKYFFGVSTDTRAELKDTLFIALAGDSFDAHDFLDSVLDSRLDDTVEKRPSVIIIHDESKILKKINSEKNNLPTIIKVKDTLIALQKISEYWRFKNDVQVLAITGSNGKTTTKGFAKTILERNGEVVCNKKSFNNHWGVPMTLLEIEPKHQWAIVEMGMNHPGEISSLVDIAHPDISLVTMVGASHLEGLGSIEGVSKEKEEIYHSRSKNMPKIKIFNLDNKFTKEMYNRHKCLGVECITFSSSDVTADIFMQLKESNFLSLEIGGTIAGVNGSAKIPVFGKHNLTNLMAAASLALSVNIDPEKIWQALPYCKAEWGRGQILETRNKTQVLFDAYNANPESMSALLENISGFFNGGDSKGKVVAVLGEMKELGEKTEDYHRDLAKKLVVMDFDIIWFVGPSGGLIKQEIEASKNKKKLYISSSYKEELAIEIESMLEPDDIVVIKGSRGIGLEQVAKAWGCSGI